MMNLYREEEYEKKSLSEKINDLKESIMLNIKTSSFARNKSIKKVTRAIYEVNPKDTESLKQIYDVINRLDLFDARFGKQLRFDVYNEFLRKVERNGSLNDLAENANKNKICYTRTENENEMN